MLVSSSSESNKDAVAAADDSAAAVLSVAAKDGGGIGDGERPGARQCCKKAIVSWNTVSDLKCPLDYPLQR